jgi:hypothetical protein
MRHSPVSDFVKGGDGSLAGMQIKRMNWLQKPTLYAQVQAWRERQRAATANFESATAAASATIAAAQTSLFAGLAEITARAVIERTNKELQAKANSISLDDLV